MNPFVNRPFPIAFGGPGAITVARHPAPALPLIPPPAVRRQPDDHLPVQLLRGPVIPQRRERLPALRAAVPAAREIPEHLKPRKMRVIPPPRPRPRDRVSAPSPLPRFRGPGAAISGTAVTGPAAPGATSPTTARTPAAATPPDQPADCSSSASRSASRARTSARDTPQLRVSAARNRPFSSSAAASASSRGQRLSTLRIPDHASRNHHAAQQTPSAAGKSRTARQRVAAREPVDASSPVTGLPSTYV